MTWICHSPCKEYHCLYTHERIAAQQCGVIARCHTASTLTSIPQTRNLVLVQKPQGQLRVTLTLPFPVSNLHDKGGESVRGSYLELEMMLPAL